MKSGGKPAFGSIGATCNVGSLTADPVAQRRIDKLFERVAAFLMRPSELVVIHQNVEAVFASVPDVPYKGTAIKEAAVLGEERIAKPDFQRVVGTEQFR